MLPNYGCNALLKTFVDESSSPMQLRDEYLYGNRFFDNITKEASDSNSVHQSRSNICAYLIMLSILFNQNSPLRLRE